MNEYKDIPGYEGRYAINESGELYSYYRNRVRPAQKHTQGYLFYGIGRNGQELAHRLVAKTFIPNPENKPFVNHKNGIKTDNRVENLEWATRHENEIHAFTTGLKNSTGENNCSAKLTDSNVEDIKIRLNNGESVRNLLSDYGISERTLYRIKSGKIWKHIVPRNFNRTQRTVTI